MTAVRNTMRSIAPILFLAAAACTENLESATGCPDLCTGQGAPIQTLTIEPVILDTTVTATGEFATEPFLFVANRGDTADTRPIIRFDSLPSRYQKLSATDSADISTVDSAFLTIRIDRRGSIVPDLVTFDAYDTDASDPNVTDVGSLFTADRLIGTRTIPKDSLKDSVRIQISSAKVLQKAQTQGRLRIGIKARTAGTQFGINAVESGTGAHLTFKVSPDSLVRHLFVAPLSKTPVDDEGKASAFSDYTQVVKAPAQGPASGINVGGYPARLSYLQFTIPSLIVDSSIVVRARLILTQMPNTLMGPADTLNIIPLVGAAAATITDITRASRVTIDRSVALIDSVLVQSREAGTRRVEIAVALQAWRLQSLTTAPHVLVLRSGAEGLSIAEGRFYSVEAAANLRPKLEISYTPRTSFGRP